MHKCFLAAALIAAVSTGCATTKRSSIYFEKDTGGSLSVWDSDMSAAVAYPNGKMCMQRALAIKTADVEVTAKVSDAILAMTGAVKAVAGAGESSELASLVATIKETATLLTTTTERTAFLDLGMFYVCQVSANGSMTDHQTAEVIRVLMITASTLNQDEASAERSALLELQMPAGENDEAKR